MARGLFKNLAAVAVHPINIASESSSGSLGFHRRRFGFPPKAGYIAQYRFTVDQLSTAECSELTPAGFTESVFSKIFDVLNVLCRFRESSTFSMLSVISRRPSNHYSTVRLAERVIYGAIATTVTRALRITKQLCRCCKFS